MGLLRNALEKRNIHDPNVPLTGQALVDFMTAGNQTHSGVTVTPENALRLASVYRCVALISGAVAGLPFHAYQEGTHKRVSVPILNDPNPDVTGYEYWELATTHVLLRGNHFAEKIFNKAGSVKELWPIYPSAVTVEKDKRGRKVFQIETDDGQQKEYTSDKIFHIPGLGYDGLQGLSVIEANKQGIGLGKAAEEYGARFFGSGSLMSGILTTDKALKEEGATALKQRWKKKVSGLDKAHDIAVLDNGAKFQPVSVTPSDAQFLETRKFQRSEISMMFGVPPHMIGDVERTTSWGSGIEQQNIGFVMWSLRPTWLVRIERRATKELMPPGVESRFKVEGLLRGDSKARGEFYNVMLQNRVMTPNEVRELEDLEPAEGGDEFLETPNNSPNGGSDEPAEDSD